MTRHNSSQAKGFSLLEVLVAVVIMSVGLLALAILQISLIRASNDSKAQSTALALGKKQIESVRSFTNLAGYIALDAPANTTPTYGGTQFTVATTITRYVYATNPVGYAAVGNTVSEAALTADAKKYLVGRDFKHVVVNVTWTDTAQKSQFVTLDDVVDGIDPADSAKVAKSTTSNTARSAQIIIKDPSSAAGVIPIAIGDNKDTAATNPKPVVDAGANETRFDILTYAALNNGTGNALAQSRVETTVAACTCDYGNKVSGVVGYRPTYWNGTRYVAPTTATYDEPAAHATLGHGTYESPYCDACCRDHHDDATAGVTITGAKFDPWRTTHNHYTTDNGGNLIVATGVYNEVCRLIRVDGIYRVAADFNDEYFNLLKTNKMAANGVTPEYVPTSSTTSPLGSTQNYQAMVLNYLDAKVTNNSTPSTYNSPVAAATVSTLETTNNINDPTTMAFTDRNDYDWLHARGLFIDHLEPEALAAIATAKATCVTNGCTTAEKQVAVLSVMPFTSINVSDLANWSPVTTDNQYINVSPGTFYSSSNDPNIPLRGDASVLAGLPTTALTATATSKMFASNSGLTGNLTAIDTDEALAANLRSDTQAFSIPAGAAAGNPGNFTIDTSNGLAFSNTYLPQFSYPNANVSGCAPTTTKVHGVDTYTSPFTCGSTNLGVPLVLTVGHYNTATLTSVTSPSMTCTDTAGVGSPKTSGSTAYNVYVCTNYSIDSATVGGTPAISITPSNNGNQAETTAISLTTVNPSSSIVLNFTSATTQQPATSCTYTDSLTCVTHGHTTTCGPPTITTFSITGSTPCP